MPKTCQRPKGEDLRHQLDAGLTGSQNLRQQLLKCTNIPLSREYWEMGICIFEDNLVVSPLSWNDCAFLSAASLLFPGTVGQLFSLCYSAV